MVSLHFIFPGNQSARFVWFFFSIFAFERQSSFASVAPWIPRWKHVLKIPTENKRKIAHIALLPTKEKGNNKKMCVWKKEGNDDGSRKEERGEEKRRKRLKKKPSHIGGGGRWRSVDGILFCFYFLYGKMRDSSPVRKSATAKWGRSFSYTLLPNFWQGEKIARFGKLTRENLYSLPSLFWHFFCKQSSICAFKKISFFAGSKKKKELC